MTLRSILFVFTCIASSYWILRVIGCENQGPVLSCVSTDLVFITENLTRIVSSVTSEKCRFVILKEPGVCQIRLDLLAFDVGNADSVGDCAADSLMTISNSKTVKTLSVCGNLTTQHLYLDFGDSDKIEVNINGIPKEVNYDILTTQFKCNHPDKAPGHCLQYYKGLKGTVKSFNYPNQQLNNQEYTVCIEPLSGSKAIKWTPCEEGSSGGKNGPFFISGNSGKFPITSSGGVISGNGCNTDFVQIFGENRRCGSSFTPLEASAKPYMMHVSFDSTELPVSPIPSIMSLAVPNRIDNGGLCPDLSAAGIVCNPPPGPCDGSDFGAAGHNRRGAGGKDTTICTCTAPALNSDQMNTGFCLDFVQI